MPIEIDGIIIDPVKQLEDLDRADCEDSLYEFVRQMWHVVEPSTKLVRGWAMEAICEHLEAVSYGYIKRLLINVSPGSSKSLLCNVFWPAWEWAKWPHLRYLSFSYAAHLTERDNRRFRDVILSRKYQAMFGDRFSLVKRGEEYVSTDKTGFKVATSIGGVGTGERGDRVILDDPHSVKDQESDIIRKGTIAWFSSAMSNRLNDMENSAIVVIMQRVHHEDVSGYIIDNDIPYEHLMIPAEFDPDRRVQNCTEWQDPREERGELFWPERFPKHVLDEQKKLMGKFGYEGQYQQNPEPSEGGVIKRDWWQLWQQDTFPPMDYIVGSLDTAYTTKTMNDYSALTIWGVFTGDTKASITRMLDSNGRPSYTDRSYSEGANKVMLMSAWMERLELHDLVEKVAKSAKLLKIDKLLIENKAAGHSVAQEIRRLYGAEKFAVQLYDPKSADKMARLYSVQHLFEEGMIFAPDRSWADMVITQVGHFPKGRNDDIVDTVSQALRHLRDIGCLTRAPERMAELEDMKRHIGRSPAPLYPA